MSAPAAASLLSPTVLVTGAAKLAGREIALLLAAQGWRVAVHYRDSVVEARRTVADCARLTPGAQAFRSNLGNETAVRNLLPTVVEALGPVDAVVNCAATLDRESAATFSFAAMDKHLRSNVGAAIVLSQALHNHIAQRRQRDGAAQGVVVNLLDQRTGSQTGEHLSFALSRAALQAATELLQASLQPLVRMVGAPSAHMAAAALSHGPAALAAHRVQAHG